MRQNAFQRGRNNGGYTPAPNYAEQYLSQFDMGGGFGGNPVDQFSYAQNPVQPDYFAAPNTPAPQYSPAYTNPYDGLDSGIQGGIGGGSEIAEAAGDAGQYTPTAGDKALGYRGKDGVDHGGWVAPALQAATGLAKTYVGLQNYKLGKKTFRENRKQFAMNYNMQKGLINRQIERDVRGANAANPGAYQSADQFLIG